MALLEGRLRMDAKCRRPWLHRFPAKDAHWMIAAASRVLNQYNGDAAKIWTGEVTARQVYKRLDQFEGIGQKKAAMAVEILERDFPYSV
jgi:hypothetical protein